MSIFRTIGNAFKDGWNRNTRSTTNGNFGWREEDEDYGGKQHTWSSDTLDYAANMSYVSFTKPNRIDVKRKEANEISISTSHYTKDAKSQSFYENAFKLPDEVLTSATKNYNFVYKEAAQNVIDFGIMESQREVPQDNKIITAEVLELPVVPSMFNPLYGINVVGVNGNVPLLNNDNLNGSVHGDGGTINFSGVNYTEDLSDCSIKTLVKLSNEGKLGRGIYKYADFMYCKNLGHVSNNRLITLRRFPIPVGDDIWNLAKYDPSTRSGKGAAFGAQIPGDTGRLVTWLDDENKLDDILKYEYQDSWVQKEGKFQDVTSQEDNGTIVGSIVNLANPAYRTAVGSGFAGSGNKILAEVSGATRVGNFFGNLLKNEGTYENHAILGRYDENKVYEPKGTVRDTHLYEGKLTFSQSFSLTFDYELRSYANVNPRTAFLDLLNNILQVTYRQGKFWGGQVWFMGAPGNRAGWQTANALIDRSFDKLSDTFQMLCRGELNFGDLLGSLANRGAAFFKQAFNTAVETINGIAQGQATELTTKLADAVKNYQIDDMVKGMLKNNLGRPALYATNTILTGDPTGLWHLTIGNPRNPIMSMGNLIIDNATVQHYGPLGIDDFPTGLKVTVNLKHAKSRDMIEIGKMYTRGTMGIGVPLGRSDVNKFVKRRIRTIQEMLDDRMYQTMWGSISPSFGNGIPVNDKKKEGGK